MAGPTRDADPDPPAGGGVPEREIRDPRVLRAMAHPVRLSILEQLAIAGQLTATELADRLGETAANCSYHLRQLAHYGFIEEGDGRRGRQRPWRMVRQATRVPDAPDDETELGRASDALTDVMLAREAEALRRWLTIRQQAPRQWRDASFATLAWDYLTPAELAELKREIQQAVARHVRPHTDRFDPARRPPDTRLVRFVTWALPAEASPESSPDPPDPESS